MVVGPATNEPLAPPGWEGATGELVRIGTPGGEAIAWFAPAFGGNCVGYAVRHGAGWVQLLHAAGPTLLRAAPIRYGCPILFPFPGHVRHARYRWAGRDYRLPSHSPQRAQYAHGFAARQAWRVTRAERDTVSAEFSTLADLPGGPQGAGYPFAVTVTLHVAVTSDALVLALAATNVGRELAPVGLGFHPHFSLTALGGAREAVRVALPGAREHVLEAAIPTGERRAVIAPQVVPPPRGERLLVARTALGARPSATISGRSGAPQIRLTAEEGCRDFLLFVPPEEPSVALEPHSCAPGAASQPEEHPDGLVGLEPGATLRLAIRISAEWA